MNDISREKAPECKAPSMDIFTVLGHDLKSPLNAVESYLEIMRNRILGDDVGAYSSVLENSLARLNQMRELITDVTDWARMLSTSSPPSRRPIDLSERAHAVSKIFAEQAVSRNIIVSTDIENGLTLDGFGREIDLLLKHLVDNAVKYNHDGGKVFLTLRKSGNAIQLTVSDTGMGIGEEDRQRLFQAFMRVKNEKTRDIKGTGMGLAIVKNIIDLHEGSIAVESETDKGTTVSVRLPAGSR